MKFFFHSPVMICFVLSFAILSCTNTKKQLSNLNKTHEPDSTIIVDCNYSFEDALGDKQIPLSIKNNLVLIDVIYYSFDNKLHKGQILTNIKMADAVKKMFQTMLNYKFPIAHAIPIAKYNNDDEKSMEANNTYSFCYRNVQYSKHAYGLAIDINPAYNPVRWKPGTPYRATKPLGAVYDPSRSGTFSDTNPVVIEFRKYGLRWGHTFSNKYDDHHFEMRINPFKVKKSVIQNNDSTSNNINYSTSNNQNNDQIEIN